MTNPKDYELTMCSCGLIKHGRRCESCRPGRVSTKGGRKAQPEDPTIYEPHFNGIDAYDR